MSIIVDSVTPNQECIETPPASAGRDPCVVQVHFHIRQEEGSRTVATPATESIPFLRESRGAAQSPSYYVQSSMLSASLSELILQQGFDYTDRALQWDVDHLVSVRAGYAVGRRLIVQSDPVEGPRLGVLFDDVMNHIFLGEIQRPDSIQLTTNEFLIRRLASLEEGAQDNFRIAIQSFLLENRELLQREDPAAFVRAEQLAFVLPFSRRLGEATASLSGDAEIGRRLQELRGEILAHLFTGSPALSGLISHLTSLAAEIYSQESSGTAASGEEGRINLYRLLLPVFREVQGERPFNEAGALQDRLSRWIRWLGQPSQSRALEYSVLEPRQAFDRSFLDQLSEPSQVEAMLERVEETIHGPDLDSDWMLDNGHLREIVQAFTAAIEVSGSDPSRYRLNLNIARLRSNLQALFGEHSIQTREFVGGSLALLRHLVAGSAVRAYWNGEIRNLTWNFSAEDRAALQSLDRWLEGQISTSLVETDIVLPVIEGVLCAAGLGLSLWGGLTDRPGEWNIPLITGGGAAGLGCTALATHYIFPTRNPYISDGIGGGIGLFFGLGITILYHFLGAGFPSPPPPGIPMDGRNPTTDWGP